MIYTPGVPFFYAFFLTRCRFFDSFFHFLFWCLFFDKNFSRNLYFWCLFFDKNAKFRLMDALFFHKLPFLNRPCPILGIIFKKKSRQIYRVLQFHRRVFSKKRDRCNFIIAFFSKGAFCCNFIIAFF